MTRLLALALLLTASAPGSIASLVPSPAPERAPPPSEAASFAGAVRVIDADTIDVGAVRVRLHGIDAAETGQTCEKGGVEWPCGAWASERVRDLFEGRRALCERIDTDRYGRAVARCAVDGVESIAAAKEGLGGVEVGGLEIASGGPVDMGAEIVGRGLAVAYRRYSDDYAAVEAAARTGGAGVFAGTMQPPAEYRAERRAGAAARRTAGAAGAAEREAPDPACPIKGNVSAQGRIYHLPEGAFYERTVIDEGQGERWFCSPEEAQAAGWRASRR